MQRSLGCAQEPELQPQPRLSKDIRNGIGWRKRGLGVQSSGGVMGLQDWEAKAVFSPLDSADLSTQSRST